MAKPNKRSQRINERARFGEFAGAQAPLSMAPPIPTSPIWRQTIIGLLAVLGFLAGIALGRALVSQATEPIITPGQVASVEGYRFAASPTTSVSTLQPGQSALTVQPANGATQLQSTRMAGDLQPQSSALLQPTLTIDRLQNSNASITKLK